MSWLRNLSPLIGLAALIGPMPQAASATERADITQLVVKMTETQLAPRLRSQDQAASDV